MSIFKKKNNLEKERLALIDNINGKHVEYVVNRNTAKYTEVIIGRDGYINKVGDDVVIMCGAKEVFREPVKTIKVWTLLSGNGVVLENGTDDQIIAYFIYEFLKYIILKISTRVTF